MTRYRNPTTRLSLFMDGLVDKLAALFPKWVKHRPLYAAEAFSGAGLFGLGFVVEGIDVGQSCEMDEYAVETLRYNIDRDAVVCDATKYTPRVPPGGIDIMFGGPPCQPFSRLGKRAAEKDPRFLLDEFVRWAKEVKPRVIVLENVHGLLEEKNQWILKRWFQDMAAAGYDGSLWKVLSADYGTPQLRPRIFLVAWPRGAPWGKHLVAPPPPTHAPPHQAAQAGLLPWVSAQGRLTTGCCGGFTHYSCERLNNLNATCNTCEDGSSYVMAENEVAAERRAPRTKQLPDDHPFFPGVAYEAGVDPSGYLSLGEIAMLLKDPSRIQSRHPYVDLAYGARVDPRKATRWVSPTLTASMAGGVPMGLMLEPGATFDEGKNPKEFQGMRRMTVREAAKLQDVPQWFVFKGPIARRVTIPGTDKRKYIGQYAQIGNGVPVNLSRAIARHILRAFGRRVPQPGSVAAGDYGGLWEMVPGVSGCTSFQYAYNPSSQPGLVELKRRLNR